MLNTIFDNKFKTKKKITSSTYFELSKKIKNDNFKLKEKKIVILSSFTLDIIEDYLMVELARRGVKGILKFLQINQFEQNILNRNSDLYKSKPDTVILFPTIEDMCTDRIGLLKKKSIEDFLKRYKSWIIGIRRKCDSQILVANLQVSLTTPLMLDEGQNIDNLNILVAKNNLSLMKLCKKIDNCFIFDFNKSLNTFGSKSWTDLRFFYIGRIRQSFDAQIFLASSISRTLSAMYFVPKKCLILDADNTLWGGVIGEDGIDGIDLSESYPGNIFKEFHRYLLRQRERGILLAVVSKNNEEDVLKTLTDHKDSLLKPKHICCHRINWNDKVENIKQVSKELNIGLESLVFVDDNPVEREWVRKKIPDVVVPELPPSPLEYVNSIESLEAFDFIEISNEDKRRAEMYNHENKRKKEKNKFNSIEEFLKELRMQATVEKINKNNLKRVVQLINKTNQFNLTLNRHNESDLNKIFRNNAVGLTLRLSDKFGDSGLVGLSIALKKQFEQSVWIIDSFLLSCRVLGRQVEDLLLSLLSEKILLVDKSKRIILEGEFKEGKKNKQVANFFPKRDFKILNGYDNKWIRDIKKFPIKRPKYIQVNSDGTRIRKKA